MFDSRIKYMMSALAGVCMMAGSAAADQLPEFWHYMGTGGEYDGVKGMIEAVNKQNPSAPVTERAVPGNAPGLRQQIRSPSWAARRRWPISSTWAGTL